MVVSAIDIMAKDEFVRDKNGELYQVIGTATIDRPVECVECTIDDKIGMYHNATKNKSNWSGICMMYVNSNNNRCYFRDIIEFNNNMKKAGIPRTAIKVSRCIYEGMTLYDNINRRTFMIDNVSDSHVFMHNTMSNRDIKVPMVELHLMYRNRKDKNISYMYKDISSGL